MTPAEEDALVENLYTTLPLSEGKASCLDHIRLAIRAAYAKGAEDAKERAAKVCEELREQWMDGKCSHTISDFMTCADAIRRG